jgi:putative sigma-54 modulation protein
MTIDTTARNTVVTARLKEIAEAGIERIGRVTHLCKNAHIILSEDKFRKLAEVTLQCKGESIVATGEAEQMETALRQALERVEQQAIRSRKRVETVRDRVAKPLAA